jgi:hypothetical protein
MVRNPERLRRFISAAFLAGAALPLCQCKTVRSYGEIRRGSVSFDEQMWGGQGGGADTGKIRSKFAERGYSIGEDGTIKADKPNLYADSAARGTDSKFGKKQARFRKTEARTNEFRTPEYVKRQQFRGVETAHESGSTAREADFGNSRDRQAGKLFGRKSNASSELAVFETGTNRNADRNFGTGADSVGSAAIASAPVADGTSRKIGYQDNAALSMDDVKKMLNPGLYSRAKGLD